MHQFGPRTLLIKKKMLLVEIMRIHKELSANVRFR